METDCRTNLLSEVSHDMAFIEMISLRGLSGSFPQVGSQSVG